MQDPANSGTARPADETKIPSEPVSAEVAVDGYRSAGAGDGRRQWWIRLGLVLLTCAVFGQTLGFGFVNFGDDVYVTSNPHTRGISKDGIAWAFTSARLTSQWHPLTWLSLQWDGQLFGTTAGGFHATNTLLHTLNVLLLFSCLRLATGSVWRSAFAAALFAIHPLHVESVAWIFERKGLLGTMFGLAALWAYLRHVTRRESGWMLLTGGLLTLSLLSQPILVTFPFALLLLDYWPLNRLKELPQNERWRTLIREKTGLFVIAGVFCVIALAVHRLGGGPEPTVAYSPGVRIGNAILAIAGYLRQMCIPIRLAVYYPHPGSSLPAGQVAAAAGVIGIVTGLVWRQRKQSPYLPVGWFWFLGTLIPVIGLVQIGGQQMADRYTYIPLIGPIVALVWLACDWAKSRGLTRPVAGAGVVLVGGLAVLAFRQTQTWRDSLTLFGHAVAVTSRNPFCENQLGMALEQSGDLEAARTHYEQALTLDQRFLPARSNLAALLQRQQQLPEARELLEQSAKIAPRNGETCRLLANQCLAEGEPEKAVEFLERAISLSPLDTEARENLAGLYRALRQPEEALRQLKAWREIAPLDPHLWNILGTVMVDLKRPEEAEAMYLKSIQLDPKYATARNNLGILRHEMGDFETAVADFRIARRLDPTSSNIAEDLSGALVNLAGEAAKKGELRVARELIEEALELTPRSFFAHDRMGRVLLQLEGPAAARPQFQAALAPDADLKRVQTGDLASCHYELGRMFAILNEFENAEKHFQTAFELTPEVPVVKRALEGVREIRRKNGESTQEVRPAAE